jgi:hypothetical protein
MPVTWSARIGLSKIQMIKEVRDRFPVGLKEAKDVVEEVGNLLHVTATDMDIINRALNLLDPVRFPLHGDETKIDYKELWETFKQGIDPLVCHRMDEMERHFEEAGELKRDQLLIDRLVFGALDYRFSTIVGNNPVSFYDHPGEPTELNISRDKLKEMLQSAFNRWLLEKIVLD